MSLILPGLIFAEPVDESQVTTFQAGQPAHAAEVNQTIQALVTAVNDNAARVVELEAKFRQVQRPLEFRRNRHAGPGCRWHGVTHLRQLRTGSLHRYLRDP